MTHPARSAGYPPLITRRRAAIAAGALLAASALGGAGGLLAGPAQADTPDTKITLGAWINSACGSVSMRYETDPEGAPVEVYRKTATANAWPTAQWERQARDPHYRTDRVTPGHLVAYRVHIPGGTASETAPLETYTCTDPTPGPTGSPTPSSTPTATPTATPNPTQTAPGTPAPTAAATASPTAATVETPTDKTTTGGVAKTGA